MKPILYFEDSSKLTFGGGQEISLLALKSLRQEFDIHLFDYAKNSIFQERTSETGLTARRLFGYGKVVHHDRQSFSFGLLEMFLLPIFLSINIFQVIKYVFNRKLINENPVLFCCTKKVLLLAVLLSFFFKCRIIFYAHNINDVKSAGGDFYQWLLKRCDLALGVSKTVCESMPAKAELLYGGIEITENKIQPRNLTAKDKIIVAVFASLQRWKGIDYFIKSFTDVKYYDKVEYWIFGDGPEKASLKALNKGNPKIIFKGFADFSSVKEQVDIVVLPSVKPEAFGMNIIKAMSCGIPVIATALGAHCELIKDQVNGLIIPPEDSTAIADKINYLIEKPENYLRISREAINSAKKFNADEFKKKIIKAVKVVLK